jgi:uncharacterized coiled-coil protein SlyX
MSENDLEARIGEQVRELETLIAQLEDEQQLIGAQVAQLRTMLQRLVGVKGNLRPSRPH